jgi:hypothetical protein
VLVLQNYFCVVPICILVIGFISWVVHSYGSIAINSALTFVSLFFSSLPSLPLKQNRTRRHLRRLGSHPRLNNDHLSPRRQKALLPPIVFPYCSSSIRRQPLQHPHRPSRCRTDDAPRAAVRAAVPARAGVREGAVGSSWRRSRRTTGRRRAEGEHRQSRQQYRESVLILRRWRGKRKAAVVCREGKRAGGGQAGNGAGEGTGRGAEPDGGCASRYRI